MLKGIAALVDQPLRWKGIGFRGFAECSHRSLKDLLNERKELGNTEQCFLEVFTEVSLDLQLDIQATL